MGEYNRNDRGDDRRGRRFGGRNSGGRNFGGDRGFSRPPMHQATCAQCGKSCEVPFRPTGDRPVYCSDCFESRRNEDGNSRGSTSRNFSRPNFEERRSYSQDQGDKWNTRGNDNGQLIDQLKSLHVKLDKIISILEPKVVESTVIGKEITEKSVKSRAPKIEVADIVFEQKTEKPSDAKKKPKEEKVDTNIN